MGLDAVELLLAVEQRFGIRLDEKESMRCDTPKLLIDLVYSKLPQGRSETGCASQRAFYLLRQAIRNTFDIRKSEIRPKTRIQNIFVRPNQKQEWLLLQRIQNIFVRPNQKQEWLLLQKTLQARIWPELTRPTWLSRSMMSLMILAFIGIFVSIKNSTPHESISKAFISGIIGTLLCGYLLEKITRPFKNRIPLYAGSLKDLVPFAQTSEDMIWSNRRNEVANIVKKLIIKQLGLDESDYFEDARFVEDLGMY